MYFLGIVGMFRCIFDYLDICWSWNFIVFVGVYLLFIGLLVFMLLIYYMVRDYLKVINFGNNYLIYIIFEIDVIVNKIYSYKNINILLFYDIFFGKVFNVFYLFF